MDRGIVKLSGIDLILLLAGIIIIELAAISMFKDYIL